MEYPLYPSYPVYPQYPAYYGAQQQGANQPTQQYFNYPYAFQPGYAMHPGYAMYPGYAMAALAGLGLSGLGFSKSLGLGPYAHLAHLDLAVVKDMELNLKGNGYGGSTMFARQEGLATRLSTKLSNQ